MTSKLLSTADAAPTRNHLLGALHPADFELISPLLEPVELTLRLVLHEPNTAIEHVYFPTTGSVSLIIVSADGAVEVGSVGREGFVGVSSLLHAESTLTRAFVQLRGSAYRMKAARFQSLVDENPRIREPFSRYTLSLLNQAGQSGACNRLHSLESRCARWLLMMHDRAESDEFSLTQEFLSFMLGVHRPAVTLAAGILQKAGFIEYSRGTIRITNRAGLERASCICYRAVRDNLESLLGPNVSAA